MSGVKLEGIVKAYGDLQVVHGIDLEVAEKEFVVLVGPSGCGKSTTLRMIAGLEEISAGTLTIDDRYMNRVAPKDRDVAMVFQNYALYPHLNVADNMAFGLRIRKMPKDEIKTTIDDVAEVLGLTDYLERRPADLTEADLRAELHYTDTRGEAHSNTLGDLIHHLFNHQTHHRGQITTLLSQKGIDIGSTDLLDLLRRG